MGTLPFLATLFKLYIRVGASDMCPIVLANVLVRSKCHKVFNRVWQKLYVDCVSPNVYMNTGVFDRLYWIDVFLNEYITKDVWPVTFWGLYVNVLATLLTCANYLHEPRLNNYGWSLLYVFLWQLLYAYINRMRTRDELGSQDTFLAFLRGSLPRFCLLQRPDRRDEHF